MAQILEIIGPRTEDGGRRTEDGGLRTEVVSKRPLTRRAINNPALGRVIYYALTSQEFCGLSAYCTKLPVLAAANWAPVAVPPLAAKHAWIPVRLVRV